MIKIKIGLILPLLSVVCPKIADCIDIKEELKEKKLNILFASSDDQSWAHTSQAGCSFVKTPAFDQIAKKGLVFTNAYASAPQCSPNRAAILTGRNIWQLEEAGTHSSYFPKKFTVFTDLLESAGYHVGYTGKGWGPGNYEDAGWPHNPVGKIYNKKRFDNQLTKGIVNVDYAANFADFMESKVQEQPFFFWFGCHEPHRAYEEGSGLKAGKNLKDVKVPGFLPDVGEVRSDLLDYAHEIEWFDKQLGKMLAYLDSIGQLENTMVVVTSDNGMPFPRAKANLYEYGVHMPLAVYMPGMDISGNAKGLVSFTDSAPTFLEVAKVDVPEAFSGKSLLPLLKGDTETVHQSVFFGRERHTHARADNLGYPSRGIREGDFLYIRNFKPERWPAGEGTIEGYPEGYYDIDNGLSKTIILQPGFEVFLERSVAKRPAEELYHVINDPDCLNNLVNELPEVREKLGQVLLTKLKGEDDPRAAGNGDIFDSYPRFGSMRPYPGFRERGKYNLKYQTIDE